MAGKVKVKPDIKNLEHYQLLKGLSERELRLIRNLLLERHYKKGEQVFRRNYPQVVLYFVAQGDIKIYLDNNGEEIELIHKVQHDHFGEMALVLESTRTASARAEEDSILLAMTSKDFKEFVDKNPKAGNKLLFNISRYLSELLKMSNKRLEDTQNKKDESKN